MNSRLSTHPITWTSANYPSNVGGPGEDTVWTYGPNRQVYESYQQGPGGDEYTFHAGKLFELVTFGGNSSNYRHYIMAGNELVAIYSRTYLGVNTLNYIQSDHQGSIASITTSSPATDYVNESFTAFGNRRNGETWSGAPTTADETAINGKSRWGYTGQTAIGVNMGLVHMNGRIEDAGIGRFLSPDPHTPNRYNTQSWNRYSYVLNNPLTFTDPSGFAQIHPCLDWCPGPNWHPGRWAYQNLGNSGSNGFEGFQGSDVTYGPDNSGSGLTISFVYPDDGNAATPDNSTADATSSESSPPSSTDQAGNNDATAQSQLGAQNQTGTAPSGGGIPEIVVTASATNSGQPSLSYVNAVGGPNQSVWSIQWQLSSPSSVGGYVIQKIHYSSASGDKTYWEAWNVAPGAQTTALVAGGASYDDAWVGSGSSLFGTASWSVVGTAGFYEGLVLPSTFVPNNPTTWAGILPSTTIDPNLPPGNVIRLYGSGN